MESGIFWLEVLGYEIRPSRYSFCAILNASDGEILCRLYASLCNVVRSNGKGGGTFSLDSLIAKKAVSEDKTSYKLQSAKS